MGLAHAGGWTIRAHGADRVLDTALEHPKKAKDSMWTWEDGCSGKIGILRVGCRGIVAYRSISSSSELIYLIVLSNLGIMTCSIAFTLRFVARITSSRMVNAV